MQQVFAYTYMYAQCMVLVCVYRRCLLARNGMFVLLYMHPVHGFSVRTKGVCLHATGVCIILHASCAWF